MGVSEMTLIISKLIFQSKSKSSTIQCWEAQPFMTWSCTKATWSWGHYAIFQIFLMWIGASETCSCQVCTAFCIRENTERNPVFSYISCSVGGKDFFLKPYDLTIMTLSVSFKLFQTYLVLVTNLTNLIDFGERSPCWKRSIALYKIQLTFKWWPQQ